MSNAEKLSDSFDIQGIILPVVGLGTFQGDTGNGQVKEVVLKALKCGYRHIDTASAYGNEREVGEAIKESGIPRESIFATTKL
jgi:alcohol dehydrogenase (NADP+)